jgi:hypothetical protein
VIGIRLSALADYRVTEERVGALAQPLAAFDNLRVRVESRLDGDRRVVAKMTPIDASADR